MNSLLIQAPAEHLEQISDDQSAPTPPLLSSIASNAMSNIVSAVSSAPSSTPSPGASSTPPSVQSIEPATQSNPMPEASARSERRILRANIPPDNPVAPSPESAPAAREPDGYLYIHCAPTSTVVKCGSTKSKFKNNQRYLNQNGVMHIMYFPVYLGEGEHLSNYEMAFHNRCILYRYSGVESCNMKQLPIIQKMQTSDLTKSIIWDIIERIREGRHELYQRENGEMDLLEFYQEVMYDVITGEIESVRCKEKKR